MRPLSLISRAFEEKQYMRVYLKQMHESLKDSSERTLAVGVYHTPLATIQLWKSLDEQMKRPEDYHTGKEDQNQITVSTQVNQISLSTFWDVITASTVPALQRVFLRGTLSVTIRATSTSNKSTSSFSKIAATTTTTNTSRNYGRLFNGRCKGNISSSRYSHNFQESGS